MDGYQYVLYLVEYASFCKTWNRLNNWKIYRKEKTNFLILSWALNSCQILFSGCFLVDTCIIYKKKSSYFSNHLFKPSLWSQELDRSYFNFCIHLCRSATVCLVILGLSDCLYQCWLNSELHLLYLVLYRHQYAFRFLKVKKNCIQLVLLIRIGIIKVLSAVLWIRIRIDPKLLPGSGSGSGSSKKWKSIYIKLNSGLFVLLDSSIE